MLFNDSFKVSPIAIEAMMRMVERGTILGMSLTGILVWIYLYIDNSESLVKPY